MKAKIYYKDEFWFVDYIDSTEDNPAVGVFKSLEEANQSAILWVKGDTKSIQILGSVV